MRLILVALLLVASDLPAAAASCAERAAFVRSVIDRDLKTGFIGKDVYSAMSRDIEAASSVCRAGQEARAQLLISSTQSRHGYPVR
jgi:hypothetical protein